VHAWYLVTRGETRDWGHPLHAIASCPRCSRRWRGPGPFADKDRMRVSGPQRLRADFDEPDIGGGRATVPHERPRYETSIW